MPLASSKRCTAPSNPARGPFGENQQELRGWGADNPQPEGVSEFKHREPPLDGSARWRVRPICFNHLRVDTQEL